MKKIIKISNISIISILISFSNIKYVSAEEINKAIERSQDYEKIILYTLIAILTLFIFFSFIYLFLKQLDIEWEFQKDESQH
jgi:cell division protein FtsL